MTFDAVIEVAIWLHGDAAAHICAILLHRLLSGKISKILSGMERNRCTTGCNDKICTTVEFAVGSAVSAVQTDACPFLCGMVVSTTTLMRPWSFSYLAWQTRADTSGVCCQEQQPFPSCNRQGPTRADSVAASPCWPRNQETTKGRQAPPAAYLAKFQHVLAEPQSKGTADPSREQTCPSVMQLGGNRGEKLRPS
jgi:hypothetical protein